MLPLQHQRPPNARTEERPCYARDTPPLPPNTRTGGRLTLCPQHPLPPLQTPAWKKIHTVPAAPVNRPDPTHLAFVLYAQEATKASCQTHFF